MNIVSKDSSSKSPASRQFAARSSFEKRPRTNESSSSPTTNDMNRSSYSMNHTQIESDSITSAGYFEADKEEDNDDDDYVDDNTQNNNQNNKSKLSTPNQHNDSLSNDDYNDGNIPEQLDSETNLTQSIYASSRTHLESKHSLKYLEAFLKTTHNRFFSFCTLSEKCALKLSLRVIMCTASSKELDTQILRNLETTSPSQIPQQLTQNLWNSLVNFSQLKKQFPMYFDEIIRTSKEKQKNLMKSDQLEYETLEKHIRMDLDRTFPESDEFKESESKQESLFHILFALSISMRNATQGYMQGWNQITGAFMLELHGQSNNTQSDPPQNKKEQEQEEDIFWILAYLMHKSHLKDLYASIANVSDESERETERILAQYQDSRLDILQKHPKNNVYDSEFVCPRIRHLNSTSTLRDSPKPRLQLNLEFLHFCLRCFLKARLPKLFELLRTVEFEIHTTKWFALLFSQQLKPSITLVILAGVLVEGWKYLLRTALAIFDILENEIAIDFDPDTCMELLSLFSSGQLNPSHEEIFAGVSRHPISEESLYSLEVLFENRRRTRNKSNQRIDDNIRINDIEDIEFEQEEQTITMFKQRTKVKMEKNCIYRSNSHGCDGDSYCLHQKDFPSPPLLHFHSQFVEQQTPQNKLLEQSNNIRTPSRQEQSSLSFLDRVGSFLFSPMQSPISSTNKPPASSSSSSQQTLQCQQKTQQCTDIQQQYSPDIFEKRKQQNFQETIQRINQKQIFKQYSSSAPTAKQSLSRNTHDSIVSVSVGCDVLSTTTHELKAWGNPITTTFPDRSENNKQNYKRFGKSYSINYSQK